MRFMNAKDQVQGAIAVQTLIFDKKLFPTEAKVREWVKAHDFIIMGKNTLVEKPGIDSTANTFRVRQRPPQDFIPGSFRTIEFRPGVKAVIGTLKKAEKFANLVQFIVDNMIS